MWSEWVGAEDDLLRHKLVFAMQPIRSECIRLELIQILMAWILHFSLEAFCFLSSFMGRRDIHRLVLVA